MKLPQRTLLIILCLTIGPLAAVGWLAQRMLDAKVAAQRANQQLAACRTMVNQIHQLESQSANLQGLAVQQPEMLQAIESAADYAKIPADQLLRIAPQSPQLVEGTHYKYLPNSVSLRRITLRQLLTLMHRLQQSPVPLHVIRLRLSAPRSNETSQLWHAELTIACLTRRSEGTP